MRPSRQPIGTIAGQDWERAGNKPLLEGTISRSLCAGRPAKPGQRCGILDKYRAEYKVSIEDFAEQVNAYIDAPGAGLPAQLLCG